MSTDNVGVPGVVAVPSTTSVPFSGKDQQQGSGDRTPQQSPSPTKKSSSSDSSEAPSEVPTGSLSKPPLTPEQSREHQQVYRGSPDLGAAQHHLRDMASTRTNALSNETDSEAEHRSHQSGSIAQPPSAEVDPPVFDDIMPPMSAFSEIASASEPSIRLRVAGGAAAEQPAGPLECELCEVKLKSPSHRDDHLRGSRHGRRARQEAILQERGESCEANALALLLTQDEQLSGTSGSDAAEAQPEGPEAPGKTVRFNSNELRVHEVQMPPPSVFEEPNGAPEYEAPSSAPPPPLWRGASMLAATAVPDQPLHGGGSFSLAAPHFCPICGIIATSEANLQDHLRGRRHARRLQYLRHMPVAERAKHIDRITSGEAVTGPEDRLLSEAGRDGGSGAAGDVLRRAGGGSQGGSMDKGGLGLGMSRGSLNLPSSMDIARYLEQVQEVEPMSPSPRGVRRRLSQRLSASSSTPAIMESAAEGEAKQEGDPLEGEEDLQGIPGQPGGSFHCDVCSIDTTSAAHLEAHMAGRKHRRRADIAEGKITRRSPHICHLCDITATSADHLALHMAGRSHQRRARAAQEAQGAPSSQLRPPELEGQMGLIPPGIPQGGQEAPSPPSSLQQGLGGQGEGLGPSAPRPNGLQNGFLGQRPGRSLEGSRAPPHQPDYFLGQSGRVAATQGSHPGAMQSPSRPLNQLPHGDQGPRLKDSSMPRPEQLRDLQWQHNTGRQGYPLNPHSLPQWASAGPPHSMAPYMSHGTPVVPPGGVLHHPGLQPGAMAVQGMMPGFYPQAFFASHPGVQAGLMAQQPFMPQHWWHQAAQPGMPAQGVMPGPPRDRMGTPRNSRERVDRPQAQSSPQQQNLPYNCQACDVQLDSMDKYRNHVRGRFHHNRRATDTRPALMGNFQPAA